MGKIKAGYHVGIVCFLVIGFLLAWAEPADARTVSGITGLVETTAEAVDSESQFVVNSNGSYMFRCPNEYETYIDGIASYVWREDKSDISFFRASPLHLNNYTVHEYAEKSAYDDAQKEWRSIIGYPVIVNDKIGNWNMTGFRYFISHENQTYCVETMYIPYTDNGWCMCWTILYREDDYELINAYTKSIETFCVQRYGEKNIINGNQNIDY